MCAFSSKTLLGLPKPLYLTCYYKYVCLHVCYKRSHLGTHVLLLVAVAMTSSSIYSFVRDLLSIYYLLDDLKSVAICYSSSPSAGLLSSMQIAVKSLLGISLHVQVPNKWHANRFVVVDEVLLTFASDDHISQGSPCAGCQFALYELILTSVPMFS